MRTIPNNASQSLSPIQRVVSDGRAADLSYFNAHPDQQRLQRPVSRAELRAMLADRLPFGIEMPRGLYGVLVARKGWDSVTRAVYEVTKREWDHVGYIATVCPTSSTAWSWLEDHWLTAWQRHEPRRVLFADDFALPVRSAA